jgi:hypothetical protein
MTFKVRLSKEIVRTKVSAVRPGKPLIRLLSDVDRCAGWNESVEFIHFGVCDCDAATGPIDGMLKRSQDRKGLRETVYLYVTAWRAMGCGGSGAVGGIRVGQVKRQMEATVGVLRVDDVVAFGRLVVALELLLA